MKKLILNEAAYFILLLVIPFTAYAAPVQDFRTGAYVPTGLFARVVTVVLMQG